MSEVRLNVLKNDIANPGVFADAENLNKIPIEKIPDFLEWVTNSHLNVTPLTEGDYEKTAAKFKLKSGGQVASAERLTSLLLFHGCELTKSELESDLQKLGFKKDKIAAIRGTLEPTWEKIDPLLRRHRLEAIPSLNSLRWRVDVRYASSNYMRKPEAVAVVRIGTNDREKTNHIHFELDLNKLSWLESTIIKIKSELLKAEEIVNPK